MIFINKILEHIINKSIVYEMYRIIHEIVYLQKAPFSYMENAQDNDIIIMQKYFEVDNVLRAAKTDPSKKISGRQKYKLTLECQKMLRKAKATLEKYLQPQILLSTVDLALCYLQGKNERGIRRLLKVRLDIFRR